jgi:hypothetical protein
MEVFNVFNRTSFGLPLSLLGAGFGPDTLKCIS